MTLISGRSMSCPFCHLGFISHADLVAHVGDCSHYTANAEIERLGVINDLRVKLRNSINKIIPLINFVHEFEETPNDERENMYVCTVCHSHGFGPIVPDVCLVCESDAIENAVMYIEKHYS